MAQSLMVVAVVGAFLGAGHHLLQVALLVQPAPGVLLVTEMLLPLPMSAVVALVELAVTVKVAQQTFMDNLLVLAVLLVQLLTVLTEFLVLVAVVVVVQVLLLVELAVTVALVFLVAVGDLQRVLVLLHKLVATVETVT